MYVQDHQGELWVGTQNGGFSRFDGTHKTFEHYKNDPKKAFLLSSNTIQVIFEDQSRQLWIGTNNGLDRLDTKSKTFGVFKKDPDNPGSISSNDIACMCEDKGGR